METLRTKISFLQSIFSTNVRFILNLRSFRKIYKRVSKILRNLLTLTYVRALGWRINLVGLFSQNYATQIARRLFLTTRRSGQSDAEEAILKSAARRVHFQGEHQVVFYEWETKTKKATKEANRTISTTQIPTVLLVHGWNGRASQLGGLVPPLLERGFRVVSFDAVGHGNSTGKNATIFDLAGGVQLAEQHYGPFYGMITHSMGGAATTLALNAGLSVERLVFIAPPYRPLNWLEPFIRITKISPAIGIRLKKDFHERYGKYWHILHEPKLLRHFFQPLLVIHDKQDHQVPWQEGQTFTRHWPDAQFQLTHNLGHNRILQDQQVLNQAVQFIDSLIPLNRKGENHEKTDPKISRNLFQTPFPRPAEHLAYL